MASNDVFCVKICPVVLEISGGGGGGQNLPPPPQVYVILAAGKEYG